MDAPNKRPNKPTNSGVRPKGVGESGMGMGMGMGKVTGAGIVVVGHRYDCLAANNQSI